MTAERTASAGPVEGTLAPFAVAVAVLAVANVVSNRLLPDAWYVPWSLLVAAGLLAIAARAGRSVGDLGLQRWGRGALVGGVVLALTLAVYLVALALPPTRDLFEDDRVEGGALHLLYQALVRIPLGTVALEEVAFRSVLPALAAPRVGVLRACVVASALFGLWHVLPAMGIGDVNPVVDRLVGDGALGTSLAVAGAVISTAVAGLVLCALRYGSGSVLASMLAHLSTNSLGYVIAWLVTR